MKILSRIAISNNKENKMRSLLIMIAIALTTMLITAIGTFGYGGIKGNIENAENLYGNYIGSFSNVDSERLDEMKKRGEFSDIGLMAVLGESDTKGHSRLVWADEKALLMTNGYSMLQEGQIPEGKNEIAASEVFFEQLGYSSVKVGDKVSVPVRRNGRQAFENHEFVISGILKDGAGNESQQSSTVLISEKCYNSIVPAGNERYTAYFTFDESIKGDYDEIDALIKNLADKLGVEERAVSKNRNLIASKYSPTSEVLVPCILICLLVVIFAAVVIYNIFQIGIARKIQEYGKIKAIGATRKQMKRIILTEGMTLAALAIPAGLAAGYFATSFLFGAAMDFAREGNEYMTIEDVSLFSFPVIIIAALISLITVRIALTRAVKTVASVTPVSAFAYEESAASRRGFKKGHKALSITGLIRSDLATNKKRNIITIVVMGVSCILFVTISSLTSSIDPGYDARNSVEYGDYQIELNYDNSDMVYTDNNLDEIFKHNPINDGVIEKFEKIDGVEKTQTRRYLTFTANDVKYDVAIFDRESFENELEKSGVVGDFTYDSVSSADGFVYTYSHFMEEAGQKIGDKLDVTLSSDESGTAYTGTAMGSFGSVSADYVITEDTARKLGLYDKSYAYLWVWCDDDAEAAVEKEIKALYDNDEHVYWESYDQVYELAEKQTLLIKVMSYTFLGLIGTICFLNVTNTMIMNVITRKREFGILQAVGMSNGQLGKMLQLEGLVFTAGSIMISLIIGLPAGYGAFLYSKNEGFFGISKYNFPAAEVLTMVLVLLIMQVILSFVLSRNVKRESIIDRIRY